RFAARFRRARRVVGSLAPGRFAALARPPGGQLAGVELVSGEVGVTSGFPSSSDSAKWHAARWPGRISRSAGSSLAQIGWAMKQRGWNLQPEGGREGLGTS